jgi:murein DD-endopeptidase MepM/ murein hydrolase activator NlpD
MTPTGETIRDELVTGHFALRLNAALEHWLPEKRLFLKSDTETRFVRLRPSTQAIALVVSVAVVAWTIVASAILMMEQVGTGSAREQAARSGEMYEQRLNDLSADRDLRAAEAVMAQERFNLALAQVSQMQSALLASEDRRKELETGIEVIQNTLRRTMAERDAALAEVREVTEALVQETGSATTASGRAKDTAATLAVMTEALAETARERDRMLADANAARAEAEEIALEKRLQEERTDAIFAQLEEAVAVSMEPLDKMFKAAGLQPDRVLDQVRRGYSGQGGPLLPLNVSTKGSDPAAAVTARANAVLSELDQMNLYRIAVMKTPFAMPLNTAYRMTSGFGYRRDPMGRGTRMHEGQDFAGRHGSPILATAEGTVIHAGWENGYGQLVTIRHDFGIETRYGHLSKIRVTRGQKVSRGDVIGDMGNTGRSTGTHLHYEIRIGARAINPMTYIKAARDVF